MAPTRASGTLIGMAREGSDRISLRFHELWLADCRKLPICAIGGTDFQGHGPGVGKASEDLPPRSELNPQFIPIAGGRIWLRLASPIPPHQS